MRVSSTPSPRQPALRILLGASAILCVITFLFGYVGFHEYVKLHSPYGGSFFDIVYDIMQLFVLGSDPLQAGEHIPWALQIARYTAPTVTLIAVIETARLLLADRLRRLRTSHRQGHVVVCGDSSVARALVLHSRLAGRRVVHVAPQDLESPDQASADPQTVLNDVVYTAMLREAGAPHADVVYAATGHSGDNISIAMAAGRLARDRDDRPLTVYAEVNDPELCVSLQARRLAVAQPPGLVLDFFNLDELAARAIFRLYPLDATAGRAPRLLVAGGSPMAHAIVVEAARQWRVVGAEEHGPLKLDYVAEKARVTLAVTQIRYPFVEDTVRATPHEVPLPVLMAAQIFAHPHDRVFLCYPDEEYNLKLALSTHELWRGGSRSVLVPLDKLAGLAAAFHDSTDAPMFDEINGALRLYPVVDAACDPDIIREDLIERLAMLIHEHYVTGCRRRRDFVAPGSMVGWHALDERRRQANRGQAADIGYKLKSIGCVLLPRIGAAVPFAFTGDEVELLAEREHQRWKADQERQGWTLADRYDERRRRSPYLVDWDRLADELRHKCRAAVADLTVILADAGFDIVRVAPSTATVAA